MNWHAPKERFLEIWRKLSQVDARPDQIARGFCVGILAGLVPLNPSPIIVASVLAWLLRMNLIAAVAGAVTSILYIPLLPVIWLAEYRIGRWIFPVLHRLPLNEARLSDVLKTGWNAYAAMCVGTIVIATPVTCLTYFVVKRVATKWARQRQQLRDSE